MNSFPLEGAWRGGLLVALVVAVVVALAPRGAQAQTALRAERDGTRHELFVAGGVGLYVATPTAAGQARACVVRVSSTRPRTLEVIENLRFGALTTAPCDAVPTPQLADAAGRRPAALLLPRVGRGGRVAYSPAPTVTATYLELGFLDATSAWQVLAQVATALGDCGPLPPSDTAFDVQCETGLLLSAGRTRPVLALQFVQGGAELPRCSAFVDGGSTELFVVRDDAALCTREGALRRASSRADLTRLLGACTANASDAYELRCGSYDVSLTTDGRLQSVRFEPR